MVEKKFKYRGWKVTIESFYPGPTYGAFAQRDYDDGTDERLIFSSENLQAAEKGIKKSIRFLEIKL